MCTKGNKGISRCVYCKPTHTDKYPVFKSHHPICHKKSVAKTLLRRADCLPSSLDSKAEERKYVSNVLKANGYTKTFLHNYWKPVTTSSTPNERETVTGFALFPTFRVLQNPSREFWIATMLKLLKNLFRFWGILLPNLRILSGKNNEQMLFILFHAMTVITSTLDRPDVSLVHIWKSVKEQFSFEKKKIHLYQSMHA